MFKLRQEHVDAQAKAILRRFEDAVVPEIRMDYPERYRSLGESGVREWVRGAIQGARKYGIVREKDVWLFVRLTFTLGREFDGAAGPAWAREILCSKTITDPRIKIRRLYQTAARQSAKGDGRQG
jgi:hypothetical protein